MEVEQLSRVCSRGARASTGQRAAACGNEEASATNIRAASGTLSHPLKTATGGAARLVRVPTIHVHFLGRVELTGARTS